jgi:hypothetical protein
MILALTSFGFGLCGLVAGVKKEYINSALIIALSLCSTLHHSHGGDDSKYKGGKIIGKADEILGRLVWIKYCYEGFRLGLIVESLILTTYIPIIFYTRINLKKGPYEKDEIPSWHISLHLAAQTGILYKHLVS